ncbi:thiamine pyrophosphate-dependent dehydrogenase E1 component subunit alpha [Conexibacter stalactiti]|uniref:Thiamine pyrophosphate-dependent dehydrogenase E1 component subunit alpha n=1 Tax=Conexibacter stalactiti TaxID=1940611 RepID=A0ABU4HU80_9ACTN|nr:thiamine pyrophosphate-dependent dehydrogenase E1 component subunit alpha [Conexibacter stalactiti]MDW5596242.1 thiamine pyrophosphate-dependent dehydrogenase E1 component subunit alpha [Conexibacter stalactiti]MEC5036884.1 thiamine pyrophosphate-dependent dehydrogenase E1 component subunit alpha [Conexibacter stalactiti]
MTPTTTTTPAAAPAGPAGAALAGQFAAMLRIRRFEERIEKMRHAGEVIGSVHLCIGQEAIPVGARAALEERDALFSTYRGHGWALACGVPAEALFGELLGKRTGVNGGRGGSAYFSAPSYGFYGENSIVGGGAPIAAGAALAARYDGSGAIALTAFGEGAMNQGSVHEALNFAAAFDLGVIFVIENNRYSELTPTKDMVRDDELWKRAAAYGIPGVRVDGNDPLAVRDAVAEAAARARAGEGPTVVETMTERLVGHYIGDGEAYRQEGEVAAAREREPLVVARAALLDGGMSADSLEELVTSVEAEIDAAAAAALAAEPADTTTVREHLHA